MKRKVWIGLSGVMLSALACQPVIAIGWREALFIFILVALLIGLPLYRSIRRSKAKDK